MEKDPGTLSGQQPSPQAITNGMVCCQRKFIMHASTKFVICVMLTGDREKLITGPGNALLSSSRCIWIQKVYSRYGHYEG